MGLSIKGAGKSAEVLIYDDIGEGFFGGITAKAFAKELAHFDKATDITVRINSSGGDVFDGVAIYNQLRRHPARIQVDIDGAALSIASVIAMAADPGQLRMSDNAFMMIHDPWSMAQGGSETMRKRADLLDGIKSTIVNTYVARTQMDADEVAKMMAEETWMDSATAKELGFIDERTSGMAMAAHVNQQICQKMPDYVLQLNAKREANIQARLHERSDELRKRLDKLTSI